MTLSVGLLVILTLIAPSVYANIYVINESGFNATNYSTTSSNPIQDAIINSSDGDILYILPGNYTTQLFVNKSISLIGTDLQNTELILPDMAHSLSGNSGSIAAGILIYSNNYSNPDVYASVSNITIDGNFTSNHTQDFVGVFVYSANASLDSLYIKSFFNGNESNFDESYDNSTFRGGVFVDRLPSANIHQEVNITNSYIVNYQDNGVTANRDGTYINLIGNVIEGVGISQSISQFGLRLSYGASGYVKDNKFLYNMQPFVFFNGTNSTTANMSNGDVKILTSSGILIYNNGTLPITIEHNTFDNNTRGITFSGDTGSPMSSATIKNNLFYFNVFAIASDREAKGMVDSAINISYNYWGSASPNFVFLLASLNQTPDVYYKTATMLASDLNTYVAPAPAPSSSSGSGGNGGGSGASYSRDLIFDYPTVVKNTTNVIIIYENGTKINSTLSDSKKKDNKSSSGDYPKIKSVYSTAQLVGMGLIILIVLIILVIVYFSFIRKPNPIV